MDSHLCSMVESVAGRDRGMYAYVIGVSEEGYLLVADGRLRKVETPKRKKLKHIRLIADAPRLEEDKMTNRLIRESINEYKESHDNKEE